MLGNSKLQRERAWIYQIDLGSNPAVGDASLWTRGAVSTALGSVWPSDLL